MRKKTLILSVLILTFAVIANPSFSQQENSVIVPSEATNGRINFTDLYTEADGEAPVTADQNEAVARRAAIMDARRNLLETIQGVHIDSKTSVSKLMLESDTIKGEVEGIVQGAQMVGSIKSRITQEGVRIITVTLRIPLKPTDAMLSKISPQTTPPVMPPSHPIGGQEPRISGIVIDASNFPVRPAMAPKILDEDGREIYGSAYVNREWAVNNGMAGYSKNINDATSNRRVASTPIIVKGIRSPNRVDIVLSNEDARKIREAASYQKFLDECKVMIVLRETA